MEIAKKGLTQRSENDRKNQIKLQAVNIHIIIDSESFQRLINITLYNMGIIGIPLPFTLPLAMQYPLLCQCEGAIFWFAPID